MQCHITCYHRQSKPCLFCTLGRLSGEEEWWERQKEVEGELGGRGEEKRAEGAAAEGEEEREGPGWGGCCGKKKKQRVCWVCFVAKVCVV